MASKKQPPQPSGPVVIRRYRAAGEAREVGIASIPHGYILIEQLTDGTLRLADDQGADVFEPVGVPASDDTEAPVAADTTAEAPESAVEPPAEGEPSL